jgi:hypothetical protein
MREIKNPTELILLNFCNGQSSNYLRQLSDRGIMEERVVVRSEAIALK